MGPAGPAVALFQPCARQRPALAAGSFQSYFSKGFRKTTLAVAPGLGTVGTSRPCCFAVSHAPGKGGSRQLSRATFLRASESNVRQWRLALGHAVGTRHAPGKQPAASRASFLRASESHDTGASQTRGWDQQALLFRCFACARQRWQPAALRATFLRASESNVRQPWDTRLSAWPWDSFQSYFSKGSERTLGSGAWPWDTRLGPAGPAVALFRMRPAKVAAGSFQS